MAAGATIHTFEVQLSDVDRGVYEQLSLKVAQHPSETLQFMTTRVLALCLEHEEGIAFGDRASPATSRRCWCATPRARSSPGSRWAPPTPSACTAAAWRPSAPRSTRTVIAERVAARWAGKRIHKPEDVRLVWFDDGFVDAVAEAVTRRTAMTVSVMEATVYLEVNGTTLSSAVHERRAG